MQELPDFPIQTEQRSIENMKTPSGNNSTFILFASVLISVAISMTFIFSEAARDQVKSVFGYDPSKKPDPLLPIRNEIQQLLVDQKVINENLKTQLDGMRAQLAEFQQEGDIIANRMVVLEKSLASLKLDTDKKFTAQANTAKVIAQKKISAASKPKEPVNPISLISVRGWNGDAFVSIKEGLDTSDLLAIGDTWRGWEVVSINTEDRSASFKVHGQIKELRM